MTELKESATAGERRREGWREEGQWQLVSLYLTLTDISPTFQRAEKGGERWGRRNKREKKFWAHTQSEYHSSRPAELSSLMQYSKWDCTMKTLAARVPQVQLPVVSSLSLYWKTKKTLSVVPHVSVSFLYHLVGVWKVQPFPKTNQTRIKLPALSAHPPSHHSGWEMLSSCAPVQPVWGCVCVPMCVCVCAQTPSLRSASWKSEQHSSKEDSLTAHPKPHTTWPLPSTTCLLLLIRLRPDLCWVTNARTPLRSWWHAVLCYTAFAIWRA